MSTFNVGFVIFPDLTQLDFTGPLQVLARLPQSATHIVAKSKAPVPSDCGLGLMPTCTFTDCPPLDLLCVPGGVNGVVGAIGDAETVDFVRAQAIQLGIEYDPAPPFDAGHPDRAPAAIKSGLSSRYAKANAMLRAGIERAVTVTTG